MSTHYRNTGTPRLAAYPTLFTLLGALIGLFALAGCGSGGGGNNPPPGMSSTSLVSGTITDVNGSPIVGATVTLRGQTTTSSQEGTYTFPAIVVPANSTSVVDVVQASKVINSNNYSGQNMIEVLKNEPDTSNIHIILSRTDQQGAISGIISDSSGRPLRGARVFAAIGPFNNASIPGDMFFSGLNSFSTTTNDSGFYQLSKLPPETHYTVTGSFASFTNSTVSNVTVNTGGTTNVPLTLVTPSGSPSLPAVQNFDALAFTTPSNPNRSVLTNSQQRGFETIRNSILKKYGLLKHRISDPAKITRKSTRSTPAGSIIETDLFWSYAQINNLLGYDVAQATNITPGSVNFVSVALLRDPLADRFSDVDLGLTPDVFYYYSVARVDTVKFPAGDITNGIGPESEVRAVRPLAPIVQNSPASGVTVNGNPTFTWTPVSHAQLYQVYVYNDYPDYTANVPDGLSPIWPADVNNPGTSQVNAPATSVVYQGPALISGHRYFWAVLAQYDNAADKTTTNPPGKAFSISPIQSFVAQ